MIQNVQELCEALIQERQERENILLSGQTPDTFEDLLTDLDDDDFLKGSVQAVDDWLANRDGDEFEQISVLEVNAFLASAQNSRGLLQRDSFARRVGREQLTQKLYEGGTGVLESQMKLIGIMVDAPLTLQMTGDEIPEIN